jgi:hypothetical protein
VLGHLKANKLNLLSARVSEIGRVENGHRFDTQELGSYDQWLLYLIIYKALW